MKKTFKSLIILSITAIALAVPYTPISKVTETRFGTSFTDDYKWLENLSDFRLSDWIEEQNNYTYQNLNNKLLNELITEFHSLYSPKKPTEGISFDNDEHDLFFERELRKRENDHRVPSDNPSVEIEQRSRSSKLFQINSSNETGEDYTRTNIFQKVLDNEGNVINYSLVQTLHTQRFNLLFWKNDYQFYYTNSGHYRTGDNNHRLLLHTVGQHQADDQIIYRAPTATSWFYTSQGPDKKDVLIVGQNGSNESKVYSFDFNAGKGKLLYSFSGDVFKTTYLEDGSVDYYMTSYEEANLGKITRFNSATLKTVTIIEEQNFLISKATDYGEIILIESEHGGMASLYSLNLISKKIQKIDLPENGWMRASLTAPQKITVIYSSLNTQRATYEIDTNTLNVKLLSKNDSSALDKDIIVTREVYTAHNGQEANILIARHRDTKLTPETPMFMYGYGGFKVNNLAWYKTELTPWFKRGGAYAHIILPGGMEYGLDWYKAGSGRNKKGTFDSFALAAKSLIKRGYTSSKRLAIGGTSNGGLLASATAMLYPKLFKATVPNVGVHDLLNFQFSTSGKWWSEDYGKHDNEEDFNYFLNLSPYHAVVSNSDYPAALITTAAYDDRVVPWHSYKLAAKLQSLFPIKSIFLHTKYWGSHSGRSSSAQQRAIQSATKWAFLAEQLMY